MSKKSTYDIIKCLMEEQGINRKILAQKAGLNENTVRGYINSGNNIPLDSLIKIADALDVSIDYLLGRSSIKKINNMEYLCLSIKKAVDNCFAKNG